MKIRILKIIIPLLIIVFAIAHSGGLNIFNKDITVRAVGDLNVIWGVPDGDPIFVVSNMLPGDSEERSVDVTNNATVARPVGVRGEKTSETGNLSSVLSIVIMEGATTLYGPVGLNQFFTDSAGPDGIALSTLGSGNTTTYTFKVTFDENAGNEFQGKEVIFDLIIGIAIAVPEECQNIEFSGPPIFGTEGNDRISGTRGNDLIFALEGNDRVFGLLGDDCIVGGEGKDELRGEIGNDIIFGNEGNDLIIGANGEDKLFGGLGNDNIRGENGEDYIEGNEGNDKITGGNSDDEILGGEGNDDISGENGQDLIFGGLGNDKLDGGSSNDDIFGNEGDDQINGKSGDDFLEGGPDTDSINGLSGTDTCDGEVEVNCEL